MFKVKESVLIKTDREIQAIRESGQILSRLHGELSRRVESGVKTLELDAFAESFILAEGAKPLRIWRDHPLSLNTL